MATSLPEGAQKRILAYLQPKEDTNSVYSRSWMPPSGDEVQFVTYVPYSGYQHEISVLMQYLEEQFGLQGVRNIDDLAPGKVYLVNTQTESSLKNIPGDVMPEKIMPFQLVFHAADQQRITDAVTARLDALKEVQAHPVPRRQSDGVGAMR